MSDEKPINQWQIDRRIPLSLLAFFAAQVFGVVWITAITWASIQTNTDNIVRLERQTSGLSNSGQAQAVQLGRIEEQINGLRTDIGRVITAVEARR